MFAKTNGLIRRMPKKIALGAGLVAIVLPLAIAIGLQYYWHVPDEGGQLDFMKALIDGASAAAPFISIIVLFFGVANYVFTTSSSERLKEQIIGEHHAYHDFADHIYDLKHYVRSSNFDHFYLVLSTIAYGIGSGDYKCAKEFLKTINHFLDTTEKKLDGWNAADTQRVKLKLFIWKKSDHLDKFGFKSPGNSGQETTLKELNKVLTRISTLYEKNKKDGHFDVVIKEIEPLDWRLFLLEGDDSQYGLTALFSKLTEKILKNGEWKTSSYSSKSSFTFDHFNALVEQVEETSDSDITQLVLDDPKKFIDEWFYKAVA